ncbi:MAG TPA: SIMPL domain-containing protein [Gemmataceae bacterium]|nr:SIMPL domain-containing protein [Gemmataceae bacterium]
MKALLATLALLACTGLASANVTVTGTGKVTYTPDMAHVAVGVSSDGKTAAEAWQKNAEAVQKLFAALKAYGIEPRDLKTTHLDVSPRYVNRKDQEPELVGYRVTYDLAVTVRKLLDLGRVLDGLVENGANRRMNIAFASADADRLLEQARRNAVADARRRAELYVTGAGAVLGQVLSISEGQAAPWRSLQYEHLGKFVPAGLPVAAGEQELAVSVSVTFAISHPAGTPRT